MMLALATTMVVARAAPAGDGVEVLTSPEHQAATLNRQALLAIYLMRVRQWPDGTPIRVFVLPSDNALHDRFARELLGTYPYVLERTWDRMVFTGTGLAPEVVRTEAEMREKVLGTRGAIGYHSTSPHSNLERRRDRQEDEHASR
jgi:hypothetical protein